MKEAYQSKNLRLETMKMIELCNSIIERYQAQGLRLTLRQLYYQLVTTNAITNTERSYKNLGSMVSDGRLCGLIDWDAIEDRVRIPRRQGEFEDLAQLARAALYSYRLPRWRDQDFYVELWVEKDALSGVLAPLSSQYHVTQMVNRGYSSQSAMYEAGERFRNALDEGKEAVLLYLGDHDPSGEDMVRDIRDRLLMFNANVEVKKVALNFDQVQQYNPPPNPAKITDSRAQGYIEKYGDECWEVDALPPDVLQQLIEDAIQEYVDQDKMEAVKRKEEQDKKRLIEAVSKLV